MKLATRVFAFKGVMRAYAEKEAYDAEQAKRNPHGSAPQKPSGTTSSASDKVNKPVAALMVDPGTRDLFEMG